MNIFYLDHEPAKCAEYMVDKHVVKMILEYCQLLSTAHRVIDGFEDIEKRYVLGSLPPRWRNVKVWTLKDDRNKVLYSATHINHPSAIWVRQSKANYDYLVSLLRGCLSEYTYRYGKKHKCEGLLPHLINSPRNIRIGPFTEPTPAMPDDCKVPGDSILSYRKYYIQNKQGLHSWKGKVNGRPVPHWIMEN